jgi:hypothetical protein
MEQMIVAQLATQDPPHFAPVVREVNRTEGFIKESINVLQQRQRRRPELRGK